MLSRFKRLVYTFSPNKLFDQLLNVSPKIFIFKKKLIQNVHIYEYTINWSKDQSKVTTQVQNPYLDYFSRSKRLFVLSFEDNDY